MVLQIGYAVEHEQYDSLTLLKNAVMAEKYGLKYMNYDIVDENLLLTEQLVENLEPFGKVKPLLEKAKRAYFKAKALVIQGKKNEAVVHIMNSYEASTKACTVKHS